MDLVGSGLGNNIDGGTATAKLRGHRICFGPEFLNGVGRGKDHSATQTEFIVVYSIKKKIVVGDAQSVNGDGFICSFIFKHSQFLMSKIM